MISVGIGSVREWCSGLARPSFKYKQDFVTRMLRAILLRKFVVQRVAPFLAFLLINNRQKDLIKGLFLGRARNIALKRLASFRFNVV